MKRNKLLPIIATCLVAIMVFYQLGCTKVDEQGRIDFYIDLTSGDVTNTNGSSQFQIPNYTQNLYVTGGKVYVNGLIVFKGLDGNYYALSQYCPNDGCDVDYQVSYDRLQCPCDLSLFNIDGSVLMGPVTVPLYRYATLLSGTSLHVYTP